MAIIAVPITKAKAVLEIDWEKLPDEVYLEVLMQGLKVLVNRGMSKITLKELGDNDTVKREALLKAEKNHEDMLAGKVRITGGAKASKVSGKVKTEAMRLARNIIKDEIKRSGGKISHYEAKEITEAAKMYLEDYPETFKVAEENLARREEIAKGDASKLSALTGKMKTSPILVKKAEEKKAKAKADKPLSAKQAGMTAKSKPKAQLNA